MGKVGGGKDSWLTGFLCSLVIIFSVVFSVRIGEGDNS